MDWGSTAIKGSKRPYPAGMFFLSASMFLICFFPPYMLLECFFVVCMLLVKHRYSTKTPVSGQVLLQWGLKRVGHTSASIVSSKSVQRDIWVCGFWQVWSFSCLQQILAGTQLNKPPVFGDTITMGSGNPRRDAEVAVRVSRILSTINDRRGKWKLFQEGLNSWARNLTYLWSRSLSDWQFPLQSFSISVTWSTPNLGNAISNAIIFCTTASKQFDLLISHSSNFSGSPLMFSTAIWCQENAMSVSKV